MIFMNKAYLAIGLIAAVTFISSQTHAVTKKDNECLEYRFTDVILAGRVYRELYAGPPNHESIEKGDRPETQSILKLDNPICAAITSQEESWIKWIIRDVKEVTLVFLQKGIYKKEYLMQKGVAVTGTLWLGHTGHHRTRILITVKEISPEKAE